MSTSNSSVQKQWDIGQSILLVGVAEIALLSAGSEDAIQHQAIVLLVHQDRIGEGVDALKGGENRKWSKLKLMVGLNNGGTARVMRSLVSCVASFQLAVACKTCFTHQETGSILYEMMDFRGVLQIVPIYRGQIEQAVGAISGYGYNIVPTGQFDHYASEVPTHPAHSSEIPGLFNHGTPRELAEILFCIFEALLDMNVENITLEGHQTGIWLISVLIWLLPEIILRHHRLFGAISFRLKVTLYQTDDGGWHMQK